LECGQQAPAHGRAADLDGEVDEGVLGGSAGQDAGRVSARREALSQGRGHVREVPGPLPGHHQDLAASIGLAKVE